jgi:hypothetical protein
MILNERVKRCVRLIKLTIVLVSTVVFNVGVAANTEVQTPTRSVSVQKNTGVSVQSNGTTLKSLKRLFQSSVRTAAVTENVTCRGSSMGASSTISCTSSAGFTCAPTVLGETEIKCVLGVTGAYVLCNNDEYEGSLLGGAYCYSYNSPLADGECERIPSINATPNPSSYGDSTCIFTIFGSLTVAPTAVQFPSVYTFSSASGVVEVTNRTAAVVNTTVTVGSAPFFLISSGCDVVAAGETCAVTVGFRPDTSGQFVGQLTINNTAGTAIVVPLNGTNFGLRPSAISVSPPLVKFAEVVEVGRQSASMPLTITNSSEGTLLSSFVLPPGLKVLSSTCKRELPAAASCVVNVQFTPVKSGYWIEYLKFKDDNGSVFSQVPIVGVARPAGDCK